MIHFVREAFGHFKPSMLTASFHYLITSPYRSLYLVAAVGEAVPWVVHKCLPGVLDAKADPTESFSSKKGLLLGQNITSSESSTWEKLTSGPRDAATFGHAFLEACAAHRHWGTQFRILAVNVKLTVMTIRS